MGGLAIAGESIWTDYTITCKARLTKPGDFNNIAICVRDSDDGQNEYMFMLEGKRQQAEWWKKIVDSILKSKPLPWKSIPKIGSRLKLSPKATRLKATMAGNSSAKSKIKTCGKERLVRGSMAVPL